MAEDVPQLFAEMGRKGSQQQYKTCHDAAPPLFHRGQSVHQLHEPGDAGVEPNALDALSHRSNSLMLQAEELRIGSNVDQSSTDRGIILADQTPGAFKEMPHAVHSRGLPLTIQRTGVDRPLELIVVGDVIPLPGVELRVRLEAGKLLIESAGLWSILDFEEGRPVAVAAKSSTEFYVVDGDHTRIAFVRDADQLTGD
jgi:hypothetical protein